MSAACRGALEWRGCQLLRVLFFRLSAGLAGWELGEDGRSAPQARTAPKVIAAEPAVLVSAGREGN